MLINTQPAVLGDSLQLQADFQDADLRCEMVGEGGWDEGEMSISLYYEEYSVLLKDRLVKSELINSITVNCQNVLKYPYSFSIPSVYAPTIRTTHGWRCCG